jgi:hypothetical protein
MRAPETHARPAAALAANHDQLVFAFGNGFLSSVHLAFCSHLPLVLSPDDVWLCIAQGFGVHVNLHAEALRERFVRHAGRVTLTVRRTRAASIDWPGVFEEFSNHLAAHLGKTRNLVVGDFSTTGSIERSASQIVLMSAMQAYFTYECSLCGIPQISLAGTTEDWRKLRSRAEALAEFDLKDWVTALVPVLDEFVAASEGSVDEGFWRSFYKMDDESGGPYVSGWVNVFFPYLSEGLDDTLPNRLAVDWRRHSKRRGARGPSTSDFPSGLVAAPVTFSDGDARCEGRFTAGFVGVSQDSSTLAVRPVIGWAVEVDEPVPS